MVKKKLTEQMEHIVEFYKDFPHKVYFVGGCIRDLILEEPVNDYDLFTPALPEEIIEYIKSKGRRVYMIGAKFGTIQCKIGPDNEMTEITTYRADDYDGKSRKPEVTYTKYIEEDLDRRDFTINTLVADMAGNIKDYKGGLKDLEDFVLRTVGNSKKRFKEDPLRILRAIRFAAKYGLSIEISTAKRIETCRFELLRISKERIISEINKMLLLLEPEATNLALLMLFKYKIFQIILPELQLQYDYNQNNPNHDFKLHEHTLKVVKAIKNEPILRNDLPCLYAALLHDIAKPLVKTWHKSGDRCNYINHEVLGADMVNDFCIKYKFSNDDRNLIVKYVREHIQADSWMKPFDDMSKRNE